MRARSLRSVGGAWGITLCAILFPHATAHGEITAPGFYGIGLIGSDTISVGNALSADGTVVVGISQGQSEIHAFRWTAARGIENLPRSSGDLYAGAEGVSGNGAVIAGSSSFMNGSVNPVKWVGNPANAPSAPLGLTLPTGWTANGVHGVSADGSAIVGGAGMGSLVRAVRWTSAGIEDLGGLTTTRDSNALRASADGSVVVGWSKANDGWARATRWAPGTGAVSLGLLPGSGARDSYALGVSGDGSVVVGFSGQEAFRWTESTGMVPLITPVGYVGAEARGVSGDGGTIVGSMNGNLAMIWTQSLGMVNLNTYLASQGIAMPGWTLTEVNGVSFDGRSFAGIGVHRLSPTEARYEAWYATIVPAPATAVLIMCGCGMTTIRARRRGS